MIVDRVQPPRDGWIRTVRTALGMSAAQLGKRLGVSRQEAADLERRERSGAITVSTLATVAAALDCELKVTFLPTTSLDETGNCQAAVKARAERDRVLHTMRLEAQDEGVDDALAQRHGAGEWLTSRVATLWDQPLARGNVVDHQAESDDGNTPLTEEELAGLIPTHLSTKAELNQWEALNSASAWSYRAAAPTRRAERRRPA